MTLDELADDNFEKEGYRRHPAAVRAVRTIDGRYHKSGKQELTRLEVDREHEQEMHRDRKSVV